jgi:hypothetical protein
MEIGEREVSAAAAIFAIVGIAALLFLSETPSAASIAEANVADPNSLLILGGTVENSTAGKFSLCERQVCISVKWEGLASGNLVYDGRQAKVLGRVKEYRGSRYFEAERIEVS